MVFKDIRVRFESFKISWGDFIVKNCLLLTEITSYIEYRPHCIPFSNSGKDKRDFKINQHLKSKTRNKYRVHRVSGQSSVGNLRQISLQVMWGKKVDKREKKDNQKAQGS